MTETALQIVKQVSPYSLKPYRLLELYPTSDGLRTRVCSGAWETEEEASAERSKRMKARHEIIEPPSEGPS